ncbi:hypothetical protein P154DRAFT_447721 [Amniculicola lignicola CBS 123094]|uniref:N-acetyltransferase domain-containing protein n=1 Tax=Amniculicola lignicola CBS 123094 TaxID=1392246 RepID=A0A6A5VZG3_9PLEO|nr:hypothetical protein P154DRAFT_447721 [Amniculicola lignicola CBS 123094]
MGTFAQLQTEVFTYGVSAIFSGPPTPENIMRVEVRHLTTIESQPHVRYIGVSNDTSEQAPLLAIAKWVPYLVQQTPQQLDKTLVLPNPSSEKFELKQRLLMCRRDIMGNKPYFYLSILATRLECRRQGAGSMLIKWGTEKADELGLQCYVESNAEAQGVYERHGFTKAREELFLLGKYHESWQGKADRIIIMIREPSMERTTGQPNSC